MVFIKLVKMIIAPIIFRTVVHGVASMSDMKARPRRGEDAAVLRGDLHARTGDRPGVVVNLLQPGAGFNIDPATLDPEAVAASKEAGKQAHSLAIVPFLLSIVPTSFFDAFAKGDVLQVLVVALFTAFALSALGERGQPVLRAIDTGSHLFFGILSLIVRLAPSVPLERWLSRLASTDWDRSVSCSS